MTNDVSVRQAEIDSSSGSTKPSEAETRKGLWEKAEPVSKVLAAVAIPIVLAAGGWWIQASVTQQSISKDYVSLSINILQKPQGEVDQGLRRWATDLLNRYAPVRLPENTLEGLRDGSVSLSALVSTALNQGSAGLAVSPDARSVAVGRETGDIIIADISTGMLLKTLSGHTSAVTSLAYSPDAQLLASGSHDGTLRLWHVDQGRTVASIQLPSAVLGFAYSPDGANIIIRGGDQVLRVYDPRSGRFLSETRLSDRSVGRP